jgi:hypothetical protein
MLSMEHGLSLLTVDKESGRITSTLDHIIDYSGLVYL